MKRLINCIGLFITLSSLSACNSGNNYAPISDASNQGVSNIKPKPAKIYTVTTGDTLYSIAWAYAMDYQKLAQLNQLTPPYALTTGQRLYLNKGEPSASVSNNTSKRTQISSSVVYINAATHKPAQKSHAVIANPVIHYPSSHAPIKHWITPATGHITDKFSTKLGASKGIHIAGRFGEAIHATAPGTVVYSGDGIRGYGNLILIQHNNAYLSAYAYNQQNRVSVGEHVQAGQTIATMGRNNAGQTQLYFEIRKNGKAVDPTQLL